MLSSITIRKSAILAVLFAASIARGHTVAVDRIDAVLHDELMVVCPRISDHAIGHTSLERDGPDRASRYVSALADSLWFFDEQGVRLPVTAHILEATVQLDEDTRFIAATLRASAPLANHSRQVRIVFSDDSASDSQPTTITLTSAGNVEVIDLDALRGGMRHSDAPVASRFAQPVLFVDSTPDALIVEWHMPVCAVATWLPAQSAEHPVVHPQGFRKIAGPLQEWMTKCFVLKANGVLQRPFDVQIALLQPDHARVVEANPSTALCTYLARIGVRMTYQPLYAERSAELVFDSPGGALPSIDVVVQHETRTAVRGTLTEMDNTVRWDGARWIVGRRVGHSITAESR